MPSLPKFSDPLPETHLTYLFLLDLSTVSTQKNFPTCLKHCWLWRKVSTQLKIKSNRFIFIEMAKPLSFSTKNTSDISMCIGMQTPLSTPVGKSATFHHGARLSSMLSFAGCILSRDDSISTILLSHDFIIGWGPGRGVPISYIPLIILKNIKYIPKIDMVNIPKVQKTVYPHIPKIDPSIPYPFIYTTLTNFTMKYHMMCKVYTDVGGIK